MKVATAGSKEARQLEKVKKIFEKVWKQSSNTKKSDDVQYYLNKVSDNKVADRLTSNEWSYVKSAVANHKKLNHSYQKLENGDIIIPIGNKLVYTDANYDSPGIRKIIEFDSEYEDDIDLAREEIYAVERGKSTIEESYEVIRLFTEIRNINQYETENRSNDGKYDRRTGRGKSQSDSYHNRFLQERIRSANEIINSVNSEKASSEDGVFFDAKNTNFSLSKDSDGNAHGSDVNKNIHHSELDIQYMKSVEINDMETAQKLVDKTAKNAGYVTKAYHGTPNGTFTVFKGWQHFTESKSYAVIYQNQGAKGRKVNGYQKGKLSVSILIRKSLKQACRA